MICLAMWKLHGVATGDAGAGQTSTEASDNRRTEAAADKLRAHDDDDDDDDDGDDGVSKR